MERKPLISSKKKLILLTCIIILGSYFCIQYGLLIWFGIEKEAAIYDALISAAVITLCCYTISNALSFFLPKSGGLWKVIATGLCLAIISILISRLILRSYFPENNHVQFDFSIPYRLVINFLLLTWMAIINIIWNVQEDQLENNRKKQESEKLLRDAELYNLRQQLQPHFLFNSLNSIIALIGTKPDEARNMTFQLSDFLRGTLRKDDKTLISFQEELEHLNLYLSIEKVRFGDRLNSFIHADERLLSAKIPSMLIQPLVENAIKHGLYNVTGAVDIHIHCELKDYILTIKITNPFDTRETIKKGTGFGLSSVQRRLFLLFGRNDLLQIEQENQLFICTLNIPQYD